MQKFGRQMFNRAIIAGASGLTGSELLDILLNIQEGEAVSIESLKKNVVEAASRIKEDKDYESVRDALKVSSLMEVKR